MCMFSQTTRDVASPCPFSSIVCWQASPAPVPECSQGLSFLYEAVRHTHTHTHTQRLMNNTTWQQTITNTRIQPESTSCFNMAGTRWIDICLLLKCHVCKPALNARQPQYSSALCWEIKRYAWTDTELVSPSFGIGCGRWAFFNFQVQWKSKKATPCILRPLPLQHNQLHKLRNTNLYNVMHPNDHNNTICIPNPALMSASVWECIIHIHCIYTVHVCMLMTGY